MRSPDLALRRLTVCAAACAAVLVLVPELAHAQSAARKAGRGLAGMTTSVLEVPGNVVKMTDERGPGWGFTLGFVQGLGMIPVRTLVGVYEFVTCPFPLPAGFEPIIEPEFPWSYFEGSGGGGGGPSQAGRR
jgi:putative exosortase-associated protein (TIGR04073 family)